MSDRELLELAAKAAGLDVRPMEVNNVTKLGDDRFIGYMVSIKQWPRMWFNPLTDEGDALRLAVKLRLDIRFGTFGIYAGKTLEDTCHRVPSYDSEATRRAIVRAAAEIGRAMP